jgi:hypothetical protein
MAVNSNISQNYKFAIVKPSNPKFVALKLVTAGRKAKKVILCHGSNFIKLSTAVIF